MKFVAKDSKFIRVWQEVEIENSNVLYLDWMDNNTFFALCGREKLYKLYFNENGIVSKEYADIKDNLYIDSCGKVRDNLKELDYPFYQGRQYKSVPDFAIDISNNRTFVATLDGFLSVVSDKVVFALGTPCTNGKIHCMVTNKDKTKVYGTCGNKNDFGYIFSYDDLNGLRNLGRTYIVDYSNIGIAASCEPYSIALSPDETKLIVGSVDRLGSIYIYTLK